MNFETITKWAVQDSKLQKHQHFSLRNNFCQMMNSENIKNSSSVTGPLIQSNVSYFYATCLKASDTSIRLGKENKVAINRNIKAPAPQTVLEYRTWVNALGYSPALIKCSQNCVHLIKGQTGAAALAQSTYYKEKLSFSGGCSHKKRTFFVGCGYWLCRPVFTHDQ